MIKFLLIISIFFIGCEDKTYTRIFQKSEIGTHIKDMAVSNSEKEIREKAIIALKNSHYNIKQSAPYSINIEYRKYSHHCNNPQTAAYDATYDGFVKLHLYHGLKEIYSVQKDFHGEFDEDVIESLLNKMRSDMKIEND